MKELKPPRIISKNFIPLKLLFKKGLFLDRDSDRLQYHKYISELVNNEVKKYIPSED